MLSGYSRVFALFVAVIASGVASSAWALDTRFHYKVGYDAGGDTLATPQFTNGDTGSVKANEGLFFGGGVALVSDANNIETELSVSYKIGGTFAENGNIKFTTLPLEALVFNRWSHVRAGGGLTYHTSPRLKVSGAGAGFAANTKYNSALGLVLQVDYRIMEKMNIGVRFTKIEYDQENSTRSFDGNTIGVVFSGSI